MSKWKRDNVDKFYVVENAAGMLLTSDDEGSYSWLAPRANVLANAAKLTEAEALGVMDNSLARHVPVKTGELLKPHAVTCTYEYAEAPELHVKEIEAAKAKLSARELMLLELE